VAIHTETQPLAERIRRKAISTTFRAWACTGRRPVARMFFSDLIFATGNFDRTKWLDTPIMQNVLDLWTIQETISEIKPALLIEIGTYKGGSAQFYAQLMDLLDTGRVLTVDIERRHELDHPRVDFLHGSSLDPDIVAQAKQAATEAPGAVMLILDGNHARDHVAQELELYAPLVTPGSVLLSQDGVIDRLRLFRDTRPGPYSANRKFLETHPEFEYDKARNERFIITHHPLGWMRRKY
jgi:cephalosporin hydroxylase